MSDVTTILQQVFTQWGAAHWWAVAAIMIGFAIRLTKPDVRWFPNIDSRWRPVAAVALGILTSGIDMIATNNDWKAALQWGVSAALAAMLGHTFIIDVARKGKEIPVPAPVTPPTS